MRFRAGTLLAILWSATVGAREPVFEVRALGVLGGEDDGNLTSYLVGRPTEPLPLMIDGGSFSGGIVRWKEKDGVLPKGASPSERVKVVREVLSQLRAVLITHSHLDHVAGLVLNSTLILGRRSPLELLALPETVEALKAHVLASPVWVDLTKVPPDAPAIAYVSLPPGRAHEVGPFKVESVLVSHTVPAAAFLVRLGQDAYLHLGDTGPTQTVWDRARSLLKEGRLRAVAVEVSFPSKAADLAKRTGHLTPKSLLGELHKLARASTPDKPVDSMSDDESRKLAAALAADFRDCPIVAIHIKAAEYETVVGELKEFQRAGLKLVIPEQGERYRF